MFHNGNAKDKRGKMQAGAAIDTWMIPQACSKTRGSSLPQCNSRADERGWHGGIPLWNIQETWQSWGV